MSGAGKSGPAAGGGRPGGLALLRWSGRVGVVAICAAVVAMYFWIVHTTSPQLPALQPSDSYYNLLVDGFRSGQLSLKQAPAPELARLQDPYDPAANAPYRLHDTSYYRGRLFLYFGVTPALILFWPYLAVSGHYLWHSQAVAFFCAAGFLMSAGLFLAVRRRYFPEARTGVLVAGIAGLGFTTVVPVMLRRPDVWEVPIGCAYFLVMTALAALWRALHESRPRRICWMAAASAAYGLALGARPSLLFGAAILLAPIGQAWMEAAPEGGGRRRMAARLVLAAVGPIALIGLSLLVYNYLRFDRPLEFGMRYQLAGTNQTDLHPFRLHHLWFNLRVYFYEPFHWSSYFPFFLDLRPPPLPADFANVEEPLGVLTKMPLLALVLAVPLAWRGRGAEARRRLGWFLAAMAGLFFLTLLPLCFLQGACARYQVDFMPALALLASVGLLAVERALAGTAWRWPVRCGWLFLLVWSAIGCFSASCLYWDLFRLQRPGDFRQLARGLDYPAHWLERLRGVESGPLEIKLQLPPFTVAHNEALVVTGVGGKIDCLFINYSSPGHIVLGVEHTGGGGPHSAIIPVDYRQPHTVVVDMGSLYPPAEHPRFSDPDASETLARTKRIMVRFDGRTVIEGLADFYHASPQTRFVAPRAVSAGMGDVFSGAIQSVRTLPAPDLAVMRGSGAVSMTLRLPQRPMAAPGEPLVVTGAAGRGDVLYVRSVGGDRIVFGFDHWGKGGPESEPLSVDFERSHSLIVHMGSLYPPGEGPGNDDPIRRRLVVTWGGRDVMAGQFDFYPSPSAHVYPGMNPIGASSASNYFTGTLTDLRRGD